MISKETFLDTIKQIDSLFEKEDLFCKTLGTLSPGTYCDAFIYSDAISIIFKLLCESLNDKNKLIESWYYERAAVLDENDKPLYNSFEELYNYLTRGE